MSWTPGYQIPTPNEGDGEGDTPSGSAGGDLGGTYPDPTLSATKQAEIDGKVSKTDGGQETYDAHGAAAIGVTETIDLVNGNVHRIILDENCTLAFTGSTASVACSFTLIVQQDGAGGNTITWPASVDWPAATPPTQTSTSNAVDVYTFVTIDNGTTWLGFQAGADMG